MSDTELKRQQHIRELIDTEEKFVKDLDVVIEVRWLTCYDDIIIYAFSSVIVFLLCVYDVHIYGRAM